MAGGTLIHEASVLIVIVNGLRLLRTGTRRKREEVVAPIAEGSAIGSSAIII